MKAVELPVEASGAALTRTLLALAWPATSASLLRALFALVDAWWAGRTGAEGLAAFGGTSFWLWSVNAASLVAAVGIASRVARATGARDRAEAGRGARDGLWLALTVSSAVGALLWAFAPQLVAVQQLAPEVAAEAVRYLRAIALGAPAYFAWDSADATLRGTGDTRTPALASLLALGMNFVLDPLFVFGWGPMPALGVAGVGYATALIQAVTAVVLWRLVHRRVGLAAGRPDAARALGMARIGLPSAVLGAGFSLIYVAITPAVAAFGVAPVAALAIGHRTESFAYMVNVGFGASTQALVGQALGAGRPELARAITRQAMLLASLLTGAWAAVLVVFGEALSQSFNPDPAVVTVASTYLAIIAVSIVPQTIEMILTGAYEGAGDTLPPLMVGVITHGLRWPLVTLAVGPLGLGLTSIWWVISGTSIGAGLLLWVLYRRRRWS